VFLSEFRKLFGSAQNLYDFHVFIRNLYDVETANLKYYLVSFCITMETISIKVEEELLDRMGKLMRKHHYATKTEFIREAIRDKFKELEREEALKRVKKFYGASKRRTTDEQLHKAGERAFEELEREHR
jgi:Arc/MetJ-type ribon-helix-helix transcriptional regulator